MMDLELRDNAYIAGTKLQCSLPFTSCVTFRLYKGCCKKKKKRIKIDCKKLFLQSNVRNVFSLYLSSDIGQYFNQ